MFDMKKLQEMQAQLQQQMGQMQEDLEDQSVEAASGGGAVTVTMNGNQRVTAVRIKPEAVDPDDLEMLEDLLMAAVNAAHEKSKEMQQNAMGQVAGGMLPPGMQFPF